MRSAGLEPIIKPRLRPVDERWFDVQFPGDVPLPAVDALMSGLAAEQPGRGVVQSSLAHPPQGPPMRRHTLLALCTLLLPNLGFVAV